VNEIELIKQDLKIARETNRILNRRCQKYEHQISKLQRKHLAVVRDIEQQANRVKYYANQLRDLLKINYRKGREER
jgi:hypothetical protein